jgi:hypothetical protein
MTVHAPTLVPADSICVPAPVTWSVAPGNRGGQSQLVIRMPSGVRHALQDWFDAQAVAVEPSARDLVLHVPERGEVPPATYALRGARPVLMDCQPIPGGVELRLIVGFDRLGWALG